MPGSILLCAGIWVAVTLLVKVEAAEVFEKRLGNVWVQPGNHANIIWAFNINIAQNNIKVYKKVPEQTEASKFLTWYPNEQNPKLFNEGSERYGGFERNQTAVGFTMTDITTQDMGIVFRIEIPVNWNYESDSATIVVDVAPSMPRITQSPTELMEGGSVSLTCTAESQIPRGINSNLTYKWQRDGEVLAKTTPDHTILTDDSKLNVTSLHAGTVTYTCFVQEQGSALSTRADINLKVMPVSMVSSVTKIPQKTTQFALSTSKTDSEDKMASAAALDGTQSGPTEASGVVFYWVIGVMAAVILVLVGIGIICWKRVHTHDARKMHRADTLPNPSNTLSLRIPDPEKDSAKGSSPRTSDSGHYTQPETVYSVIDDDKPRELPLPPVPVQAEGAYLDAIKLNTSERHEVQGLMYSSSNSLSRSQLTPGCNMSMAVPQFPTSSLGIHRSASAGPPSMDNRDYLTTVNVREETCVKGVNETNKQELQNQYSSEPLTKMDVGYLKLD